MRSLQRADGIRRQAPSNPQQGGAEGFPLLWMQRSQGRTALTPPDASRRRGCGSRVTVRSRNRHR
jgi:hypothetical protein